ncbi:uncharacterized protein LAJ45_09319 [Morchella importuna]|uniref:uncharacterized protein n=1 Tax=Morchella importuna TaxID=1174673 RepID=UPI001E8CC97D|nr:uncharacterized protein LAJ45_09319 [Morchella importuna]KAH8146636.1 hypothetical protein LAJ45_09319 [Morchella importuna]
MAVEKKIIKDGDGVNKPKKGDTVTMHYTGTLPIGTKLADGTTCEEPKKFDSSVDRGEPFVTKIGVGKVIRGWDEGVPTMSLGEKAKLTITGDYAYGERGFPNLIPRMLLWSLMLSSLLLTIRSATINRLTANRTLDSNYFL